VQEVAIILLIKIKLLINQKEVGMYLDKEIEGICKKCFEGLESLKIWKKGQR